MSRYRKRSYSRHSRDYHDDREGGHRDYHGDEAARGPRFPESQSRSRSRSRSRDRGSVGGEWDWKRRPLRVLSPQSPLRTQSPFRGRGSGRPSPRRGRGSQPSPLSSASQVSHHHGPRFETHEVDFHDGQVRELLFSSDHKLMIEIKKKFPGVSRIDLAMKKGIAFSGSSGAIKVKCNNVLQRYFYKQFQCLGRHDVPVSSASEEAQSPVSPDPRRGHEHLW